MDRQFNRRVLSFFSRLIGIRLGSLLAVLTVSVLLVACGGGGTGNNDLTPATFVAATLTNTAPTVTLNKVASIDFSGRTELLGKSVSIATVTDSSINSVAANVQDDFDADLSDPISVQIIVPVSPAADLPVTVFATQAFGKIDATHTVTVYGYSSSQDAEDGSDTWIPLSATLDTLNNSIEIFLPATLFQQSTTGNFVANLKIGIAVTSGSPPSLMLQQLKGAAPVPHILASATGAPTISYQAGLFPCPLASCTEVDRYNPLRKIPAYNYPKKHLGTDFKASKGTPVTIPSGGIIYNSFTKIKYQAEEKRLNLANNATCATTIVDTERDKCSQINRWGGITLSVKYGQTYALKLLHLDDLIVSGNSASGIMTGNTGKALIGGAHLHIELMTENIPICKKQGGACSGIKGTTDLFPNIVKMFNVAEMNSKSTLSTSGTYSFTVDARDSNNVAVFSSVVKAKEKGDSTGYDPTRKVCLSSSAPGVIKFPDVDNKTSWSGNPIGGSTTSSYCVAWPAQNGAIGGVTAIATTPNTVIRAQYSIDPSKALADDPLDKTAPSNVSAELRLGSAGVGASLTISPASQELLQGTGITLTATYKDSTGATVWPNDTLTWSSNNLGITVESVHCCGAAMVTALASATGSATITVTDSATGSVGSAIISVPTLVFIY